MAAATRPAPIASNWAETGDKTEPSDAFKTSGWPVSQVPPSRQRWNWILGWISQGVRYLLHRGIPGYHASEAYTEGDKVQYEGVTYSCLQDVTGTAPPNSGYWERWGHSADDVDTAADARIAAAFHLDDVSSDVELSGAGDATVAAQLYTAPGIKRLFVTVGSRTSDHGAFDVVLSGDARLSSVIYVAGTYISSVSGDMPGAVSAHQTASSETTRTIGVISPGGTLGSSAEIMLEIVGT